VSWYLVCYLFEIANWKVQIENFIFPIFIFQLFHTFFGRQAGDKEKKDKIKNLRVSVSAWFKNATCMNSDSELVCA